MIVCSFCGLATESPHEKQAACIEALHAEISRVREFVDRRKLEDEDPGGPPPLRETSVNPPTQED
jgi:hypothetical protein